MLPSTSSHTSNNSASAPKQTLKKFSVTQKQKSIPPAQLQWARTGMYDISPEVKDRIEKKINNLPKTPEEDAKQLKELLDKVK